MAKRKDGFSGERALVLPTPVVHEIERDPVLSMLHITDIGYYPKAHYHFRQRTEPIPQFVFIYCTDGAGWCRCNNQEYSVGANQYFILPADAPHAYGSDEHDPWTIYWIHFKGTIASSFVGDSIHPVDITPGIDSRISNRNELFEELFHTLEMGYSLDNLRYANAVFHHYLGSLRYWQQYRNANRDDKALDTVTVAIHYMKENLEKKLSLADIASHTGYSSSHFSVLFNKRTGYTPLHYFNQLKVQQACHLLDFTEMKINQICYKIGVEDTYYFSRLFSKIMGMSPQTYKKQKKG